MAGKIKDPRKQGSHSWGSVPYFQFWIRPYLWVYLLFKSFIHFCGAEYQHVALYVCCILFLCTVHIEGRILWKCQWTVFFRGSRRISCQLCTHTHAWAINALVHDKMFMRTFTAGARLCVCRCIKCWMLDIGILQGTLNITPYTTRWGSPTKNIDVEFTEDRKLQRMNTPGWSV